MADLSKIPDLELRQKIKPLQEKRDALSRQYDETYDRMTEARRTATEGIQAEIDSIGEQIDDLLAPHPEASEIVGVCEATGLPVFDTDETKTRHTLACVA